MTTAVHPGQLVLDELLDAVRNAGACDRRRVPPGDGAARLLRELVVRGLPDGAVIPAARLVLALELAALEGRQT